LSTRRLDVHRGHVQDTNVSGSVSEISQKGSRNLIEQLTVANERSRESSRISDQSNNDGPRNIGQSNNMSTELGQLQNTVSHLQEFCSTLLQAVTPQVSGNQIVLLTNIQLTTSSNTGGTNITPSSGERRNSDLSADSINYRKDHHSFMAKLEVAW